jgi:hypothetical protein
MAPHFHNLHNGQQASKYLQQGVSDPFKSKQASVQDLFG